jgi:hypothetical protein
MNHQWELTGIDWEKLVEIVAHLTESYTSNESTSVSEETANKLMEAVLYTIRENFNANTSVISLSGEDADYNALYQHGIILIKTKLYQVKMLYEIIMSEFEDYGCKNYRDTVCVGIMEFLKRYDMKFDPQNQLLSLDYPLLYGLPDERGVDMILTYLKGIRLEQQFLANFDRQAIINVLTGIMPSYKTLYMDNICYAVLRRCIHCMAADREVSALMLYEGDEEEIRSFFQDDDTAKITLRIQSMIQMILRNLSLELAEQSEYFLRPTKSYATKIAYQLAGDIHFNLNEM